MISSAAKIYSLAFSPDSKFLAASSDTETIHIFRLPSSGEQYVLQRKTKEEYSFFFLLLDNRHKTRVHGRVFSVLILMGSQMNVHLPQFTFKLVK